MAAQLSETTAEEFGRINYFGIWDKLPSNVCDDDQVSDLQTVYKIGNVMSKLKNWT